MMANICVINDDMALCTLLADLLSDRDRDTVTCCDSANAHRHLNDGKTDLVIVDLMTKKPEGGWDLLTFLQLHPRLRALPVLVCSAFNDELLAKEEWLEDHDIGVIEKPFDLDDLYARVDMVLQRGMAVQQ